ncbi:MAG TPA: DMT family transporter [Ramlibacter sp.]|nr:DMT family transporter [Ramlibacter sp.]
MTGAHAANRRGVLAMSAGMGAFVTNDAMVKMVSETLPAWQLIFLRGVFAIVALLLLLLAIGALRQLPLLADRRVWVRAALDAVGTMTYLTSLFHLPIANATAINMATPLFITLFAVVALHEQVGWIRWLAIATGFTGVLMVVQPAGAAFNAYALLCLAGTIVHAARDLATRYIDPRVPALLITFSTAIGVTVLSACFGLAERTWTAPGARELALLAAASVFLSAGYFLLTIAMRAGEMSLVAPFRYTGLLFALAFGFIVWGDVPNALAWAGIALLVAAGLSILHGERRRPHAELDPAPD